MEGMRNVVRPLRIRSWQEPKNPCTLFTKSYKGVNDHTPSLLARSKAPWEGESPINSFNSTDGNEESKFNVVCGEKGVIFNNRDKVISPPIWSKHPSTGHSYPMRCIMCHGGGNTSTCYTQR